MTDTPILVSTEGRVGLIRLNRPAQLNALNDALMDELGAALLAFDADPGVGAIVITGSGKAFAAGADIAAMADWGYMDVYQGAFITRNWEQIRQVRKPVLAAVAGFAMGGGCELALACDIVVAAESAKFALPEIKLAMLPGAGGTQRLPRAIGKAKAMDMCLSARLLDAQEADRYGLVSRVVPDAELLERTLALAAQIAGYSLPALMAIKESVNRAYESSDRGRAVRAPRTLRALRERGRARGHEGLPRKEKTPIQALLIHFHTRARPWPSTQNPLTSCCRPSSASSRSA
jgi:enoyl-CoA hydratase